MGRLTIGTAGHVDHGKSALVEALTGVHPDRLAEERRRGMTLDLGFGHLRLEQEGAVFECGVVDVPGHERFIRTMLAGAAGVDVVLFVLAADAGVQPQTVEHAAILRLLGLQRGVVALSKCDLADSERRQRARRGAEEVLPGWPVVEVSVRDGAGLDALRKALWLAASRARERDDRGPARLPIDRSFSMPGFGTVVTGTLAQGTLRAGDELDLAGSDRRLRIRGLQAHGESLPEAHAGARVAVNVAGAEAGDLCRGDVLAEPGVYRASLHLDVLLDLLPEARLKARDRAALHWQSAERIATVVRLERDGRAAQLRLQQPVAAAPGDRFILRQLSPPVTIGGGVVVDAHAPAHRTASFGAVAATLHKLGAADPDEALFIRLERAGSAGLLLAELAVALGQRADDLRAWLAARAAGGEVVLCRRPEAVMLGRAMAAAEARIQAALAEFHAAQPSEAGAAIESLDPLLPAHWIAIAVERLTAAGILRAGLAGFVALASHHAAPAEGTAALRQTIEDHFRTAGLAVAALPAALANFADDFSRARGIVASLAREGALIECQPGLFVHRQAVEALHQRLAQQRATHSRFTVTEFKDWTGLTRKHAIPLLEYLDRVRATRRQGDTREILLVAAQC
ncbi:MAG TPA: selenocysteine-specific translation elongation factor [Terriglobales bacterium]|nr:selenocysteine-specific translation elongation factor [Terriglobales bacterium]